MLNAGGLDSLVMSISIASAYRDIILLQAGRPGWNFPEAVNSKAFVYTEYGMRGSD